MAPVPAVLDRSATFSTDEVCVLVGVSYRNLDYWTRRGIVSASVADAHGSGTSRRWSAADVDDVRLIARLRTLDVGLDRAGDLLRALRAEPGRVLVVSASAGFAVPEDEVLDALRRCGGAAIVVAASERL